MKVLSICMWDAPFWAFFITPDYSNTKRMCSNDCFFVRTFWLEARQRNGRRAEARGLYSSAQEWGAPRSEKSWDEGMDKSLFSIQQGHLWECHLFMDSFIHLSDTSWAPLMYRKYITVPNKLYLLNEYVFNEWNLEKQPFMSQLEM